MNPFAAYRAINTKIHGKRRNLLDSNEWAKAAQYQSVPQVIEFLKKKEGYKEIFSQSKLEEIHRGDLEVMLDRRNVQEIEQILHYFSGSYKEFFKTFLMEYELNDLQLILRTLARNEDMEGIEKLFVHSEKYGLSIYNKLVSCRTVSQAIDALNDTIYYQAIKSITQEDMDKREFHMEMRLYILFYKTLMERASKLKAKDEKIAKQMIGTKVDFINAQWIYRAIKYYDISTEEILIYSLPGGNKLTYRKLKALCYTKNVEELKMMTEKYLAYPLFKQNDDTFLDCMTDRYLLQTANQHQDKEGESIQTVLSYIYTLGIEENDLIALTEGIRYSLPDNELRKYLVHTI